jgi:hypothetical protein
MTERGYVQLSGCAYRLVGMGPPCLRAIFFSFLQSLCILQLILYIFELILHIWNEKYCELKVYRGFHDIPRKTKWFVLRGSLKYLIT